MANKKDTCVKSKIVFDKIPPKVVPSLFPKQGERKDSHNDSLLPQIEAQLYAQTLESP